MGLTIYVGYAPYIKIYFVNSHGIDTIDKNTATFNNRMELLNYLSEHHKERKALLSISEDLPEGDKKEILNHIRSKQLRLKTQNISERVLN